MQLTEIEKRFLLSRIDAVRNEINAEIPSNLIIQCEIFKVISELNTITNKEKRGL